MKTIQHPSLPWTITFESSTHTYTDNEQRPYTSITTLVASLFPPFDEQAAAAQVSARSGSLEMSIIQQWHEKAKASSEYGTLIHAYAESLILPGPDKPVMVASSALEKQAFDTVSRAVSMLADTYDFMATELIIFDPLYQIAGTVDILARNRATGALAILDWKTCEKITNQSYVNAFSPLQHVRDSKFNHYALQLSLYAFILTDPEYSAYPTVGEPVELALIHVVRDNPDPVWIPLPNLRDECRAIIDARKIDF